MNEENLNLPSVSDGISGAIDVVGDMVTGIPTPIRKNLLKAFGQLCTAAVDIPVAYLEGKAAEKRAETAGRVKLIGRSADQLATQLNVDPNYIRAAATKFTQRVVREQVNLDNVSQAAIEDLRKDSDRNEAADGTQTEAASVPEISADWLNAFETEAREVSSEQLQRLFGKILAGEIRKPASFSIRAVKLMRELDSEAARTFQQVCSLCVQLGTAQSYVVDARVPSLGTNAGSNGLSLYGLSFDALNALQEYGLIIADYNSYADWRPAIAIDGKVSAVLMYAGQRWGLVPIQPRPDQPPPPLHVSGVALSHAGRQLLPVIETRIDESFTKAFREWLDKIGYTMLPIVDDSAARKT